MHERLMQLRGKVFGRQRIILGKVPEEMDVTLQIDKDLYVEAKFDTEADRGRDGGIADNDGKKSIGAGRLRFFRDPDPVHGKEKGDARNTGYNAA